MNTLRIIFITIFLLSGFIAAKSFVAVNQVDESMHDLRRWLMNDMLRPKEQRNPVATYDEKIASIQKQWTVMRPVSVLLLILSLAGVVMVSRPKNFPVEKPMVLSSRQLQYCVGVGLVLSSVLWVALPRLGKGTGNLSSDIVPMAAVFGIAIATSLAGIALLRWGNNWQKIAGAAFQILPSFALFQIGRWAFAQG